MQMWEIYPVRGFFALILPFMLVIYLGFLIGLRPPKPAVLASLLGGLLMAMINALVDLLAYYAHWWHYTILNDLIFRLPLPFYATPLLYYGSLAYLLTWRFWRGRGRWFALLLLIGTPLLGIARDIYGWLTQSAFTQWENVPAALIATIVMWLVMFYSGYLLFQRFAPARDTILAAEAADEKQNIIA